MKDIAGNDKRFTMSCLSLSADAGSKCSSVCSRIGGASNMSNKLIFSCYNEPLYPFPVLIHIFHLVDLVGS